MTKIRSRRSGRIRDRRGSGGGGLGGFGGIGGGRGRRGGGGGIPIGMGAGGGLVGLLVLAAVLLLPGLLDGGGGGVAAPGLQADDGSGVVDCVTEIEQIVCGAVDDVSGYWEVQYPETFQGAFPGTDTVFYSGAVSTGCGQAPAEVGPFYCPADQLVYLDLAFLQRLQRDFGATGDLAAQYIVAHEYGHHVQNVTGISDLVDQRRAAGGGANELSVALELQADCFAGAWAASAAQRDQFDRPGEIQEALAAAEAVGDDRILERAGRPVDPESFTHGTAEQRRTWFEAGFRSGDPAACTTFDGALAP